ncbi:glycosyltransferase family 4 protein [Qipengyuania spongiae]|uniref:Glycosyltransferase family 4 protein n=1 Tax=Qipengyuania spongiae TaxID=2909673 RepID=A0ABY5T230_9SPHN|nr:glycosyltransferase family 4 protein [Qipengyuania spongiae]UVI40862.1 glycosyltransferase family 4 protein [Qipengyuania spongiae]
MSDSENLKRVAIVSNSAFALKNFRGPLITELLSRRARVFAFAPNFNDREKTEIEELGAVPVAYHLDRSGTRIANDFRTIVELACAFRRLRIDLSFNFFIKPAIYGTLAAWLARVPHRAAMIEGLGYAFTYGGERVTWRRRTLSGVVTALLKLSLRHAQNVFFLNEEDESLFLDKSIVRPRQTVRLAGIGVKLDHYDGLPPPQAEPVVFLLVGRVLREKGIIEFVEAARIVKREYPNAQFVLAGGLDSNPGGIAADCLQQWQDEGLLEWRGHVEDIRGPLAEASVFVLPSWREGSPRSTQEALAAGRPVITTDVPGCRSTVVNKATGFLVPVRDPRALARAMQSYLREPVLIAEMGERAQAFAQHHYDVQAINDQILERLGISVPSRQKSVPRGCE